MAKTPEPQAPAPVTSRTMSLNEFCKRLSLTEKRYVLIAGFHRHQEIANHLVDTWEGFNERLAVFLKTPLI
ncbi:hypothetical protein D7B12_17855 [Salmonella enterica]|nr:hypothetical protein [Salmonella enterica]